MSLRAATGATELVVEELVMRFGGITAIDGLSLRAPVGQVTGLIGPNGAGKTTTFNVCSGAIRPTEGSVSFDGEDLTSAPASHRAHVGIGRTFQRIELFDSLSVAENVALGREARLAGTSPFSQIVQRPRERAAIADATEEALDICGLADLRGERAGRLSTGQRRLVELARALSGDFRLLLLDEPSSGLDVSESERFTLLLKSVVTERGLGILIVEHDMPVISGLCDYVYVLDFGSLIFEGRARDVLSSDIVRAAYLGTEPVEVAS